MLNDKFWDMIEATRWAIHREEVRGYESSKRALRMRLASPEDLRNFREKFSAMRAELDAVLQKMETKTSSLKLGAEAWDDLLSDIIGRGREVYEEFLEFPARAHKYEIPIPSSFVFAIPFEDEYEPGSDDLARRRRRREAELGHAVEFFDIMIEEVLEDAREKFSVLRQEDLLESFRLASLRWQVKA